MSENGVCVHSTYCELARAIARTSIRLSARVQYWSIPNIIRIARRTRSSFISITVMNGTPPGVILAVFNVRH